LVVEPVSTGGGDHDNEPADVIGQPVQVARTSARRGLVVGVETIGIAAAVSEPCLEAR
jgi:hypothetical protein